ncbi:MAG: RNA-directed DNA polymerase, partial [Patescibacteria group bacterium]
QLFANVYMNEFDQFMKHKLRVKNYLRYSDDFMVVSDNRDYLESLIPQIGKFLKDSLTLDLHPNKITIRKFHQGIDFLGYIILPYYQKIRTKTKKRMLKRLFLRIREYKQGLIPYKSVEQSLQSYLGVLSHANTYAFTNDLKNQYWFWLTE